MPMIECKKLDGTTKMVHKKDLILRPSAYAIILRDPDILLMRLRHTGKYHLPGGGVHIGERIKDTLKREVREETGLEIEVGVFAHFEEIFFYFDPSEKAYHGLFFLLYLLPKELTFDRRRSSR
jgi:8-oxo-dGTP pyrophosphatase MutT (NUDIX family)